MNRERCNGDQQRQCRRSAKAENDGEAPLSALAEQVVDALGVDPDKPVPWKS